MTATLALRHATISRGPQVLISDASLTIAPGNRIGLVGPNGVGKSTLLAALAGDLGLDAGERTCSPPTANVGWLRQEPIRNDATASEAVRARTGVTAADDGLDAATAELAAAGSDAVAADRDDVALQRWLSIGAADFDARLGSACDEVGLDTRLLDDRPTRVLSGGEAARVGLVA